MDPPPTIYYSLLTPYTLHLTPYTSLLTTYYRELSAYDDLPLLGGCAAHRDRERGATGCLLTTTSRTTTTYYS